MKAYTNPGRTFYTASTFSESGVNIQPGNGGTLVPHGVPPLFFGGILAGAGCGKVEMRIKRCDDRKS